VQDNSIDLKIEAVLKTANATSDLTTLKKSLKELTSMAIEYGETNEEAFKKVAAAAGDIKDRIADARQSIAAVSGKPIENLSSSLNLARGSLQSLDFSQAATGIKLLATNLNGLKFGDLSSGVSQLSQSIVSLGKAIMANPILLLAGVVILLISKFDELKNAGGIIGKVFTAIGEAIKSITEAITMFSDALGLTAVAAEKKTQKILDGLEKEKEKLIERYDLEAKLAADLNKNTDIVEARKLNAIEENAKKIIETYNKIKEENGTLTEKQQEEYEKAKTVFEKTQDDKLEFLTRVGKQVMDSEKETQFQIEQNRINLMADGAAKVSAQADLDRRKQTKDEQIELDKRLDQLHSYYTVRLANLNKDSKEAIALRKTESEQLKKIYDEGQQKIADLQKEQNKKIREYNLQSRATTLSDEQKLQQDQLQLTLDNFKVSDTVKLNAQKEYYDKAIVLSNELYDVQIKQAAGSAKKQEFLRKEKLIAAERLQQQSLKLQKDFDDKQEKIAIEKHNQVLEDNVRKAELLKEFSKTYQQSLEADLAVLKANNEKAINDDWNTYREKIKNVNLSEQEKLDLLAQYKQKEIDNNEALEKREKKRKDDEDKRQKDEHIKNVLETDEIELGIIQKKGGIHLGAELRAINKIYADKKVAQDAAMQEELKAVGDNEQAKDDIRTKYAAIERQRQQDLKDDKIRAEMEAVQKVTDILRVGTEAAGLISDIATNLENKKRDKNGKLSLEIQKKQFNRTKALGIAEAVINTAASIAKTLGTLGIPAGIPASIVAAVMGGLQIAKIATTQFKGDSGGSGGGGAASVAAPSMASAPTLGGGSNSLLRSQQQLRANKLNSIGSGTGNVNVQMEPIRVHVLESDITKAQSNVSTVQTRASLAGP